MKEDLLAKLESMGDALPANTLDELIDELGGPSMVAEMTGRKGRVVSDDKTGEFRYESRSTDESVSLDSQVTTVDVPTLAAAEFARGNWFQVQMNH